MKRSVLHIIQPTDGGVPLYVAALAQLQSEAGWRVDVASPASGPLAAAVAGSDIGTIAWEARRAPGLSVPGEIKALRAILQACDADLIHLHSAKAGLAGRWTLKGRRPTVFQPHSWTFEAVPQPARPPLIAWERAGARWCDRIVCVSESEKKTGTDAGVRARWAVIANGVDLSKWQVPNGSERRAARGRLNVPEGPLVVSVGRVRRQKGHDVLLDAWPSVLEQVPKANLVVVGDGPERRSLSERGVPRVSFVGEVPDARDWVWAADLVALPSRYEGMSLAMLEAMATATGVVITDVAGAREAMGSDSGAIVPIEDAGSLSRAIVLRLLDPDLAAAEGRAGRARIEKQHAFERTASQMLSLYEEVVSERAR